RLAAGCGVLAVLWCGLLTTLSSSSFIALLAGLAVLAALLGHWRVVAAGAGALAVAAVVLVVAFPTSIGLDPGREASVRKATSGRNKLLTGGTELFADRPVLGWGSGAFALEYRRAGYETGPRAVAASHTIPLTVAVEQGLVGLAAYLALLAAAFRALLRGARRGLPGAGVTAAFTALVVHTLLYAAFLEDPLSWALLAAGMAWGAGRRAGAGEPPPRVVQTPAGDSRMTPTLDAPRPSAPVPDAS
ncbi:MAG: O-antigen ligase family protein, partial [Actinomycetota bacterium]|nr:O-antigen ligase family protein [Actinomycetota bacterium]